VSNEGWKLPEKAHVRTVLHDMQGFCDLGLSALSEPTDWHEVQQWLSAVEVAASVYREQVVRGLLNGAVV
jgi:hypothetical protein